MPSEEKWIKNLLGCTAVLTLVLVALGGFVRGTNAGLACPDWPLCFGQAIPSDFNNGVAQEVIHRYIAAIAGILTSVILFFCYKTKDKTPNRWRFMIFLASLLVVQIIFGGLTVTMKLNPFIVTSHLGLGTIFFQSLIVLYYWAPSTSLTRRGVNVYWILSLLLFLQLLLGGFVGSSMSALVCPDIPLCLGQWLPFHSGAQMVHMSHRYLAIFITIFVFYLFFSKRGVQIPGLDLSAHLKQLLLLSLVQVTLGVINVLYLVPVSVAVAHLVIAQLLIMKSIWIARQV